MTKQITTTPPFEPMKTGLPTDIKIDSGTFYPKVGDPLSPAHRPLAEKPEKEAPAAEPKPAPETHKKRHHKHHHHKH